MPRPRLTVAQLVATGKARHMSRADLDLRRAQEALAAVQAKTTRSRPASAATPAATGKASKPQTIPAAPPTNAEESSLERFLMQVQQSRDSFGARLMPGQTVALDVDGQPFDWRPACLRATR